MYWGPYTPKKNIQICEILNMAEYKIRYKNVKYCYSCCYQTTLLSVLFQGSVKFASVGVRLERQETKITPDVRKFCEELL